jgi:hypothetical protein
MIPMSYETVRLEHELRRARLRHTDLVVLRDRAQHSRRPTRSTRTGPNRSRS